MNTFYLFSASILAFPIKGVFLLAILFAACFFLTHLVKYALLGWKSQKTTPPPPQKEEEKAPTPPPEPVYYIVERKQRRAKAQYSQPKEIRFK